MVQAATKPDARKEKEEKRRKKRRSGEERKVEWRKRSAHLDAIGYQKVTRALDNFSAWTTEIRLAGKEKEKEGERGRYSVKQSRVPSRR